MVMDEWTWEEQQDTLDYRQWKAEQDAQRELDAAIADARLQWEAEYEAKLLLHNPAPWDDNVIAHLTAHAPEPEPLPPDPPEGWDEDDGEDWGWDTPGGY